MQTKTELSTVVLIDDDSDDIRFMEEAINSIDQNINLISFVNPIEAIRFLSAERNQVPDLVFIDINMPLKRGDECLLELRNIRHLNGLPIIMYSTTMSKTMTRELMEAGATATFQKPILLREYKSLLLNVFEAR
jgi:DNA-binding NtrC family response regulator